ncbi:unnamed protein product [Clonostachys rhizophaga]|uniref:Uncharacterized protein n=1 Tax=Clonostachys rhizophaga TaxID=160324 RepID=A0A9N9YWT2_9HYPO|nr:unnamed protein product [Clonostachys rhizophaga]
MPPSVYTALSKLVKPLLAGGLLRLSLVTLAGAWIELDYIDVFQHLAQTEVLLALLPHFVLSGDQSTFYKHEIAAHHPRLLSIIHEAEVPIFNPTPSSANNSANSLVPDKGFLEDLISSFGLFDKFSNAFLESLSDLSYELHPNTTGLEENPFNMSFLLNDPDSPNKWTYKDFSGKVGDSGRVSNISRHFLAMEFQFGDFYNHICPPIYRRLARVHYLHEKQYEKPRVNDSDAPRLLCLKKLAGDARPEQTWTPPFGCHKGAFEYSEEKQDTAFIFENDEVEKYSKEKLRLTSCDPSLRPSSHFLSAQRHNMTAEDLTRVVLGATMKPVLILDDEGEDEIGANSKPLADWNTTYSVSSMQRPNPLSFFIKPYLLYLRHIEKLPPIMQRRIRLLERHLPRFQRITDDISPIILASGDKRHTALLQEVECMMLLFHRILRFLIDIATPRLESMIIRVRDGLRLVMFIQARQNDLLGSLGSLLGESHEAWLTTPSEQARRHQQRSPLPHGNQESHSVSLFRQIWDTAFYPWGLRVYPDLLDIAADLKEHYTLVTWLELELQKLLGIKEQEYNEADFAARPQDWPLNSRWAMESDEGEMGVTVDDKANHGHNFSPLFRGGRCDWIITGDNKPEWPRGVWGYLERIISKLGAGWLL